ncbi:MAG: aminoglycoside phosphotransferase family protein [Acidimicrobiia bacterium]|nr:aminoglycoside phosphotransferase family protein [Acidimicrobiia bacterium]NNF09165.1 aminoglycoside phosphotransferase family protein [Acidimicrobiia bacterium]NNL69130.1 aminoglycoside phosphotransferase family protein [Acidimicrobiia bacterium]
MASFEMTERVVLSNVAGTGLSPFMPEVLYFEATSEALHYLVEEVDGTLPNGELVAQVASRLPAFHRALRQWAETTQPKLATRHDHYFAMVSGVMEEILRGSGQPSATALLDNWPAVVALHAPLGVETGRQPIHGDLHRWNVFVTETAPGIKVIDWDSVVWGDPLVDLATLLIDESSGNQKSALNRYGAEIGYARDKAEVERSYLVNRFRVALLWSCLFASRPRRARRSMSAERYLDEAARLLEVLA